MEIQSMFQQKEVEITHTQKGRHGTAHPDNTSDKISNQLDIGKPRNLRQKFYSTEIQSMSWQTGSSNSTDLIGEGTSQLTLMFQTKYQIN